MSDSATLRRVLVIANKSWEADPLVSVCMNPKLRPAAVLDNWSSGAAGLFSTPGNGARPAGTEPTPRCVCETAGAAIEIWCIEDWMGAGNHSSSKVKITSALPGIFAGKPPDFVVAFGTASFPASATANGCVVVGSSVYLFNPYRGVPPDQHNPANDWDDPDKVGHLIPSSVVPVIFQDFAINPDLFRLPIDGRLSPAPVNSAVPPVLLAAANYVAVSELNITNYDDYAWTDPLAVGRTVQDNPHAPVGSIETTHGLIRIMSEAPFIFVSGITDRLGSFNQDLAPRAVAQNFLAAHNAGIGLVWTLPQILQTL